MVRAQTPRQQLLKTIPEAFKACTQGWEEVDMTENAAMVLTESEFYESQLDNKLASTHLHMADAMEKVVQQNGCNFDAVDAFTMLSSDAALGKVAECTTKQLVKLGFPATNVVECRQMLAHRMLRS